MPPRVTLTCTHGPLAGQEFQCSERASDLIGRAEDCQIQTPPTAESLEISRRHCLVELHPPLARVRDFMIRLSGSIRLALASSSA